MKYSLPWCCSSYRMVWVSTRDKQLFSALALALFLLAPPWEFYRLPPVELPRVTPELR